ncbi:MAG: hypothetical protein U9Q03_01470 [Patescibacteria group bacterium]|nr:hypothetical protein [Patescibacteria group bacterium]
MDPVRILKLRHSGVIPSGLTVMEEMDIVRGLEARTARVRDAGTAQDSATILTSGLPEKSAFLEPESAIARPEPRVTVPDQAGGEDQVIHCVEKPYIPDGWEYRREDQIASRFQGRLIWTPDSIRLHLVDGQRAGRVKGFDLKEELEGQPVLPANVLYWQLEDSGNRISGSWKGKWVFYWGTIYRVPDGRPCVFCLYWRGGRWDRFFKWLDDYWASGNPAAVSASI